MPHPLIYSPMEKRAILNARTKRWQRRNRAKVKGYRAKTYRTHRQAILETNKRWRRRHPEFCSRMTRSMLRRLPDYYIRSLLKRQGIEATAENISAKRESVRAQRSKVILRLTNAIATI